VREIPVSAVTEAVRRLCIEANTVLAPDLLDAYARARESEESPLGRDILGKMLENAEVARAEGLPACQDTGMALVFLDLGQDAHLTGGDLAAAVDEGVRQGYAQGRFRASTLDPVTRVNPGDNTPAALHLRLVPGSGLGLTVMPKGFGGENFSRVRLFPPAAGLDGVRAFVVETVDRAGSRACPPLIVGVGLGGTLELAALTAKRSLLRPMGQRHPDPALAGLERELLAAINRLGIGPQGLGGRTTALDVRVETTPTHIGSLPVAVNLQCHCHRHASATL
jgi:fumarate hydratase subunit alpha